MEIRVEVTSEDIQTSKGKEGVFDDDPIAKSLKRLGYSEIDADEDRILITDSSNQRLFCKTPRPMNLFIEKFDNYETVSPEIFVVTEIRPALEADERPISQFLKKVLAEKRDLMNEK